MFYSDSITKEDLWDEAIFRKKLQFDGAKSSEIISTALVATSVGVKAYRVELTPLESEKNTINNSKNFGVEVIDQKTTIALIADRLHPDLGALKKAIESNEQRSVSILKPKEYLSKVNDFQLVILYQPDNSFNSVLEEIYSFKILHKDFRPIMFLSSSTGNNNGKICRQTK